jgi:hypothetical protein
MALGPIEVLVIEFPGSRFSGEIIPELQRLIDNETISIIDGLMVSKDLDGDVTFIELDELDANEDAAALAALVDQIDSLISDEDVAEWAAELEPGSSEAILVFEHTWAKGFRDAIVNSGGVLVNDMRIPGAAVEELLAELASMPDD